jgi:hypothetical protein
MLWSLVSSAYVIFLYRKLKADAGTAPAAASPRPGTVDAGFEDLDRRLSALEARLPGLDERGSER